MLQCRVATALFRDRPFVSEQVGPEQVGPKLAEYLKGVAESAALDATGKHATRQAITVIAHEPEQEGADRIVFMSSSAWRGSTRR